ncbi:winged helix-turn-helix transcriptional regulator [Fodinicola feengrottensis]|uniref:winged helix-turn-helix transcriptional regulator n=1 Tax=Fodinicola feengrottensis TaxID=435914 RepID=UPI002442C618|nr:winged helix-turn-helix transcriptional regulator [Fodinicola feengrottensis]
MELPNQAPAASLVFQTMLAHGPLSRAEIGRRTGLSSGAVTKATSPLLDDGWIAELGRRGGENRSPAGRPPWSRSGRSEPASSASRSPRTSSSASSPT